MTIRKTEINEKSQAVVEFSFDAAAIEAEKVKVFRKKANTFNVPGFRRGKAPRSVIEKMYGTGIFLEDAINELINANWDEIIAKLEQGEITAVKAMELTGTKKTTFYKLLKQQS